MAQTAPGESEDIDSALRRFKRAVSKVDRSLNMCKYRHFETSTEKRKDTALASYKQVKRRFHS